MKLYLIGGLGADERVFKFLKLDSNVVVLKWITPIVNESISSYANRLMNQIDDTQEFGLLGVSFGGIVALEISKISKPTKLILISSVEIHEHLPSLYIALGRTKILNLIPNRYIKPPSFLLRYLFGAKNKKLLNEIIGDTDPAFIRWALDVILNWCNVANNIKPIRIHGDKDKLIPLKGDAIKVANAGHFMIVDNATEISELINKELKENKY